MSDERLLSFTRAFADAVRAGLPLAQNLKERGLPRAAEAVEAGKPLHESLAAQNLFPPLFLALVRAGEESGKLDKFLDRFAAALESRIDFSRRLTRALLYPVFAAALAAGLFALFTLKGAPFLFQLIVSTGAPIPPGAKRVMEAGDWIKANWLTVSAVLLAAWGLVLAVARSGPGRKLLALAGHWLPGARYVSAEARAYSFEATLELLLGAGLRPRDLISLLGQYFADDPVLTRRLRRADGMLQEGKGFLESLGPCVPEDDRGPLAVAEKAGTLDGALGKLAARHREEHLHRLKVATVAIQLAATCALAPACFGLVAWILWPSLSMLGNAAALAGAPPAAEPSAAPPPMEKPAPLPQEAAAASQFNEAHAGRILAYMQEHEAEPPKKEDAAAKDAGPAKKEKEKKKPWPKLKPGSGIQGLQRKNVEPTTIRSGLE